MTNIIPTLTRYSHLKLKIFQQEGAKHLHCASDNPQCLKMLKLFILDMEITNSILGPIFTANNVKRR